MRRIGNEERQKGMIDVDKIEDIRKRARWGQSTAAIARELGVSEPTVRKYRSMEDLYPVRDFPE